MRLVVGGRSSGKTTELVRAIKADPNAVVVTATRESAKYLHQVHGIPQDQIVAPSRDALMGRNCNVYVDNAERILARLLGCEGGPRMLGGLSIESDDVKIVQPREV